MAEESEQRTDADDVQPGLAGDLERFRQWRSTRPFRGGVLLVLGGIVVALPTLLILEALLIVGGGRSLLALTVGGLLVFAGAGVLLRPELSTKIGVVAAVLAVTSLLSSFGGYFVGALLSSAGAVLCFAWQPVDDTGGELADTAVDEPADTDADAAAEEAAEADDPGDEESDDEN